MQSIMKGNWQNERQLSWWEHLHPKANKKRGGPRQIRDETVARILERKKDIRGVTRRIQKSLRKNKNFSADLPYTIVWQHSFKLYIVCFLKI